MKCDGCGEYLTANTLDCCPRCVVKYPGRPGRVVRGIMWGTVLEVVGYVLFAGFLAGVWFLVDYLSG